MIDEDIFAALPANAQELAKKLGEQGDREILLGRNCLIGGGVSERLALTLQRLLLSGQVTYVRDETCAHGFVPLCGAPGNFRSLHQYPGEFRVGEPVPYWLAMLPNAIGESSFGDCNELSQLLLVSVPDLQTIRETFARYAAFLEAASVETTIGGDDLITLRRAH